MSMVIDPTDCSLGTAETLSCGLVVEVIDEGQPRDGKSLFEDLADDNDTGINSYPRAEKAESEAQRLLVEPEIFAGNKPVFRDQGHALGEADIAAEEENWMLGEIHVLAFFGDVA